MKRKFILLLALIMTMAIITACNNNGEEIREEMDMREKLRYAEDVNFEMVIFLDGQWVQGNMFSRVRALVSPSSELFADFYTEVRFIHHPDEVDTALETVIFVFPTEDTVKRSVTALNWEVVSANLDLSGFGLSYPITVKDLVDNYEYVNRLLHYDEWLRWSLFRFANMFDTRIEFELNRIGVWNEANTEKVLGILDQLNMPQDEAGPILRAAGSLDAFVAVTDLMLTQGLSAEEALARHR